MGKKSRNAGTTKDRVRTCDKVVVETPFQRLMKMSSKMNIKGKSKLSKSMKQKAKAVVQQQEMYLRDSYDETGEILNEDQTMTQLFNRSTLELE